ncbi:hypothetical protein GIB67_035437 [Kingdonia uniflora]|uniref:MAR-binding filament-like protein 1-1 n=1 Tax=Kingdonia uniflora TaxID=39325 RepID=A0A7J7P0L2_9MAGN|nr:hypothetical protein GIB67_035437 [Kingdonia uniflora]
MGSSCFLQSPFTHSLLMTSSSTSSPSFFLFSFSRNSKNSTKKSRIVSLGTSNYHQDSNFDADFSKRKGILVLGISALPFLQLKATAVESLVKDERNIVTSTEDNNSELQQEAPLNPILSLLNTVGIIGSGVLGALYTLAQKEKTTTEATIESLKNKLVEKESSFAILEKSLVKEQEERSKETKKAREAQLYLSTQLMSANRTISGVQKELQSEKRLVEEYKEQISVLQNDFAKSREDKKFLEAEMKKKDHSIEVLQERISLLTLEIKDKEETLKYLNASLSQKAAEIDSLSSLHKKIEVDLTEANSEVKALNDKVVETQKELHLKNSIVDDLNIRLTSLAFERDDINKKVESLQKDYNQLKLSSDKKAAVDADILAKRENKLHQLEETLGFALSDTVSKQELISSLTQERDDLIKMLEIEAKNVKNVTHELRITEESLETSRTEVSDLSEQLKRSIKSREELASEVVQLKTEFAEVQESLKRSVKEEKSTSKALSDELVSVKNLLEKAKEDLQTVSDELAEATEARESLKKELLNVYKKAETASHDLKEERKVAASLRKELEASQRLVSNDREVRKSLETDLEDATKSLDELNVSIVTLSRELDISNSRVESLETEKEMLYNSLKEQKEVSQEARENVEDAHDLILKLGKERENLDKRGKKLEEEMALAKGEILRLRSQINSSKSPENDVNMHKSSEGEGNATRVTVKKTRRRRAASSDDSS